MAQIILHFLTVVVALAIASPMNRPIQIPELKNPACGLLPETGECRALARRYAFNKTLNACEEFNYGGCDGNANNFQYKDLCEYVCQYNRRT
eukprot:XP_019922644.1 PREDICTED: kunitz-type serine protease inhibitor IX [Crassostrea gigas]